MTIAAYHNDERRKSIIHFTVTDDKVIEVPYTIDGVSCSRKLKIGGLLRIFSGVPDDFSGSFVNLCAKGGFLVSARAENGRLYHAEIYSPNDSILSLKAECGVTYSKEGGEESKNGEKILRLEMRSGETITVSSNI